jgi:hypothetical protein
MSFFDDLKRLWIGITTAAGDAARALNRPAPPRMVNTLLKTMNFLAAAEQ